MVYYYVDKTESLSICHIFSNCCFVTNFVDKGLVDDSTNISIYRQSLLHNGDSDKQEVHIMGHISHDKATAC